MTADNDFVLVQRKLFDSLLQRCEHCHDFGEQLQYLSNGRVVFVPSGRPGATSSKRKTQPGSGPQEPNSQPKRLRAEAALSWFLRNAPKAAEWRKRQVELGLKTVEQYEGVIRAFGNRANIKTEASQGDGHSQNELVNVAERLALLTRDSLANANLQRSFALFQALILLSYCEVLRRKDVPYETVDGIIRHIAEKESDRKKLLASALWINDIINKLVSNGWTIYRATELFFISMFSKLLTCEAQLMPFSDALSLTYLTRIHNNENAQSILEHLKTDEFVKHEYRDCLGPEYTIPSLIASLLDACNITADKLSYEFLSR